MFKKSIFFITLIMTLGITGCDKTFECTSTTYLSSSENSFEFSLADYNYRSASVLPTIIENGEQYCILSREAYGHREGKLHKYDDFSGKRDRGDTNAITSAAREFLEEGILAEALGWDLTQTEEFIKPENNNTWAVIAYSKEANPNDPHSRKAHNVTFLTHFDEYKDSLFSNFYDARKKEMERYKKEGVRKHHRTNVEKDRIAKVKWNDLKNAIINQEDTSKPVYVRAHVMDPVTRHFHRKQVTLRPFLVIKLQPFFLNQPYEQGENDKIRFYQKTKVRPQEEPIVHTQNINLDSPQIPTWRE